jgi:hypothetical protein
VLGCDSVQTLPHVALLNAFLLLLLLGGCMDCGPVLALPPGVIIATTAADAMVGTEVASERVIAIYVMRVQE